MHEPQRYEAYICRGSPVHLDWLQIGTRALIIRKELMKEAQQEVGGQLLSELTAAFHQARIVEIMLGKKGLLDALNSPDINVSSLASSFLHDYGRPLNEYVVKDARFPGNQQLMIRGNIGASGFYPSYAGIHLLRRALQNNSPETAIEWLLKVLTISSATGKIILAIWGVTVDREIQLAPGVKIVPINNLPDSEQKEWLTGHRYFESSSPIMSAFSFEPPKSALIADHRIEPLLCDQDALTKLNRNEIEKISALQHDIALALTVVGPRASVPAAQWFTFDDPDIQQASMMSGSHSFPLIEILPNFPKDYAPLDPSEAKEIIHAYLALRGNTLNKVRVALKRLNQAQRRHDVGDRAVELSTAFETLLGDNATSEMTHKIKVRSVRLIGGTDEIRKKNSDIINKTYKIRSSLVHTGLVDAAGSETICGQRISVSEIIDRATIICADLIKIIIRKGAIPDWSNFDIVEQT